NLCAKPLHGAIWRKPVLMPSPITVSIRSLNPTRSFGPWRRKQRRTRSRAEWRDRKLRRLGRRRATRRLVREIEGSVTASFRLGSLADRGGFICGDAVELGKFLGYTSGGRSCRRVLFGARKRADPHRTAWKRDGDVTLHLRTIF